MRVHLDPEAASSCTKACDAFIDKLNESTDGQFLKEQFHNSAAFDTARQIGAVYSLFAGEDLRTLLDGFATQAKAMSVLFAAAGGMIDAQDEAAAAALGKAAEEPAGLKSIGLMSMLASMHGPAATVAVSASVSAAEDPENVGGYNRVGPEDVSSTPLERIVTAAEALDPSQFEQVQKQVTTAAGTLDSAASTLQRELDDVLGGAWQGEFAQEGARAVHALTGSAFDLVGVLEEVATRADGAQVGFHTTRSNISSESLKLELAQARTPGLGSGPGATLGPASPGAPQAASAARAAAEEQARAVVNTEYSPAVMKANLDDLQFPTAFRVVSGAALGGATGIDPVSAWNTGGIPQTAGAAAPGPAALAAAGAGGPGASGVSASGVSGPETDATGASAPIAATDAATEQALLASRAGGGDASGLGAAAPNAGAGPAGAGPVNAATTAAGAPLAPMNGAPGQQAGGTGTSGIRGLRGNAGARGGAAGGRDRDRGFGSAAGLVGGGGAAAAGAAATRMGGAGTLAGLSHSAGPGVGGPSAGAPGAGAGNATGATTGAGGMGPTSSSTGGPTAGRPGAVPMGMMGAGGAGQSSDRRGHTPAGYLTNATNTTDIIGDPVKVAPAVLGRHAEPGSTTTDAAVGKADVADSDGSAGVVRSPGRVLGRSYTGSGDERDQARS